MSRYLGVAIIAIALAGCSGGSGGAPTTTAARSQAPQSPTGTALSGAVDLCAVEGPCPLRPGKYAPTIFRPLIRFSLAEGWSNELHVVNCISLSRSDTEKLFFLSGVAELGTTPAGLSSFAQRIGLTISHQSAVDVAGRPGLAIDVTSRTSTTLFTVAGMGMGLNSDQRARLISIQAADRLLVIFVRADLSGFDRFMAEAQRVIDTVELR